MATCIVPLLFMAEIVFSLIGDAMGMAADAGHAARQKCYCCCQTSSGFEKIMRVKASVALTPLSSHTPAVPRHSSLQIN